MYINTRLAITLKHALADCDNIEMANLLIRTSRLKNNVKWHGMFIMQTLLVTVHDMRIKLPLAQMKCIAFTETLKMISKKNKSSLDDLEAAFRFLKSTISLYFKNETNVNSNKQKN